MTFDVAAERYDAFMGRWSRPLAPLLADLAGVTASARVLDVGCGTGMLTAELVRRVGPALVSAVDPSAPFVAAMGERFPDIDLQQAGADALPYPDGCFDAVLAQLVVHFLQNPVAGLHELRRVTRSGGFVAACVWDHAGKRGPLVQFWDAARSMTRDIDDESLRAGTREGHLVELFELAGLTDVVGAPLTVTLAFEDFDDWWQPYTFGVGPAGDYVRGLGDAKRAELRARCEDSLGSGPFEVRASAWCARGRRACGSHAGSRRARCSPSAGRAA